MLKTQIAESLEIAFSQYGFAEPSVSKLKDACNVSLRTLYKYFPSKEKMIIAALDYRHQRYLAFLVKDLQGSNASKVLQIFAKLEHWMGSFAAHGCMSLNAIAAFPENNEIRDAVARHKHEVCQLLGRQSGRADLEKELFILHESVSSTWPILGKESVEIAQTMVSKLMGNHQ
ncbi:TetR/AcrR family transcriptional regulator [Shewanella youngdeokensis]|uniref:TetR/AcrR family transcriptional regulator n=1 Tax=Shewanella youngdeokensis TaxID=2999068 RepID=A0ABZ0JZR5_9GAMM|nr:TetR/AcrR family transcriptional regulator [Shewanella sp. DAU334]